MDPLIELSEPAKARIKAKEAKAAEQLDIVRRACEDHVARAQRTWGGYIDLHQDELQDAIDEARRVLDEAAIICARYVFNAHAAEYAKVLRDPKELKPVLATLREAIIKQYGERTRMAIQLQEAMGTKKASAEKEWFPSGHAILSLRKADGTVFESVAAEFSAKAILVWDVAHAIEQGDMIIRTLPSGLRVGLIVGDPGYHDALGSISAHFEVKAHRAAPIDSREPSDFWRTRRADFEKLSDRQRDALGLDREHPRWLRGYCSRLDDDERAFCEVDGGLDAEFRSKFEDIATQAGIALGSPPDRSPVDFWVSCLCLDLLQNSPEGASTELLRPVPGGGFIVDLLGSSAAYCSRLAAMADRNANDTQSQPQASVVAARSGSVDVTGPAETPIRSACTILEGPEFWRARRSEFDSLLERQWSTLKQDTHPSWLKGWCHFSKGHGRQCQRADGFDGRFISDFDEIATRAASGLGRPPEFEPVEFWIYCLGQDLYYSPERKIKGEFIGGEWGGVIQGLVESSAAYCSRLAAKAERQASDARFQTARPSDAAAGREQPTQVFGRWWVVADKRRGGCDCQQFPAAIQRTGTGTAQT